MQRQLLYIINPISGTKNKEPVKELIIQQTNEAGFAFDIIDAVPSGDYSFLKPIIQAKGITDIVIAGGDGTVNGVLSSLHSVNVQFGIIPCGSGNGLALCAGISKDTKKALQTVFTGKAKATDAFFVNDKFACMLCGVGFDAQVAHDFARHHKRGLGAYINKVWLNFIKAPVYPFILTANNQTISVDAYFITIANSNQFGNNFTIAPKASLTDGLLDIVIATQQSKLSFLLQTLKQVSGLNKLQQIDLLQQNTSILYFRVKQLAITNINQAPLHIDGEPVNSIHTINVQIKEKAFRLIYP